MRFIPCHLILCISAMVFSHCTSSDPLYCDVDSPCQTRDKSFCSDENVCITPAMGEDSCGKNTLCTDPAKPICSLEGVCTIATCEPGPTGDAACLAQEGAPVCDGDTLQCRGCRSHGECTSKICDSEVCVSQAAILYVDKENGGGGMCGSKTEPCNAIAAAIDRVESDTRYIHVAAANYGEKNLTLQGVDLSVIFEEGAVLNPLAVLANETIFSVRGDNGIKTHVRIAGASLAPKSTVGTPSISCVGKTATLSLTDVDIRNASVGVHVEGCSVTARNLSILDSGTGGIDVSDGVLDIADSKIIGITDITKNVHSLFGIDSKASTATVQGVTIESNLRGITTSGGSLELSRSKLFHNIYRGLQIEGTAFSVFNNFIVRNGIPDKDGNLNGSNIGVSILNVQAVATQDLRFNTIVGNHGGEASKAANLLCEVNFSMVSSGNIIRTLGVEGDKPNVASNENCGFRYSNIEGAGSEQDFVIDSPAEFVAGTNGVDADYHLTKNSPGIDQADPGATLAIDFDGDPRPSNGVHDMGADEYVAESTVQ